MNDLVIALAATGAACIGFAALAALCGWIERNFTR